MSTRPYTREQLTYYRRGQILGLSIAVMAERWGHESADVDKALWRTCGMPLHQAVLTLREGRRA